MFLYIDRYISWTSVKAYKCLKRSKVYQITFILKLFDLKNGTQSLIKNVNTSQSYIEYPKKPIYSKIFIFKISIKSLNISNMFFWLLFMPLIIEGVYDNNNAICQEWTESYSQGGLLLVSTFLKLMNFTETIVSFSFNLFLNAMCIKNIFKNFNWFLRN